jgi:MFS family permease
MQSGLFMQAFGSYSVLLQRDFGWSATTLSIAFAMTRAESGILGPLQGWMIDRFGPQRVIQVGLVMMAAGFIAFSQMQTLTQFFIFYLLMAVGASLGGFLAVTTSIVNWFQRYRSRALATSQTGFAIGGAMVPLLVFFLETFGWRETAFGSGILVLLIGLPLSLVIRHRPADHGEHPDGISPEEIAADTSYQASTDVTEVDFTAGQAMRTRAFWMISLAHSASLLVVGSLMLHLPLYLTGEGVDMSLQKASFVVGALPLMQFAGQAFGGIYGDRINKRLIVFSALLGHATALLVLTYAVNDLMIWAFVPLHGLAWGVRGPILQSMRADYFGPTHFGTIMGFSSMIMMIGMITGPLLAGFMFDRTGAYTAGFTILAIAAGLGSVFIYLATPPAPPDSAGRDESGTEDETETATAAVAGG